MSNNALIHNLEETSTGIVVKIIKDGNSVNVTLDCVAIKKGIVVLILSAFLIGKHVDFPRNVNTQNMRLSSCS